MAIYHITIKKLKREREVNQAAIGDAKVFNHSQETS
jgi:hypothetical protein